MLEASSKRQTQRLREFPKYSGKSGPPLTSGNGSAAQPESKQVSVTEGKQKWEDKFTSLQAQCRAQGLCMKCGEKWGRGHRCPKQVPLHILEELLDIMSLEDSLEKQSDDSSSDEEVLSLSVAATEGIQGKKTMRLHGMVNKQQLLILVDSGSSNTFISQQAVTKLQCSQESAPAVTVSTANGQKLVSDTMVPNVAWWTQGHTCSSPARVLDLPHYDMILGMDWLE